MALTRSDVIDMVRTGACEIGLLTTSSPLQNPDVVAHHVGDQRLVLVTPADGPFPAGRPVRREQLAGQRLIVGQRGTGIRGYVDDLRAQGVDVRIAVETEHRMAFLPLVLKGVGLAVVTESWTDLSERAGALVLDLEPPFVQHDVLVTRKGEPTPAARAFLDTAAGPADKNRL